MSEALDRYLNLEQAIEQLDESGDEDAADELRPRAAAYWRQMSKSERAMLNERDTAPKPLERYRGSAALSLVPMLKGQVPAQVRPTMASEARIFVRVPVHGGTLTNRPLSHAS